MENNNRETKDYQQPISPLEYLNKRKEKKEIIMKPTTQMNFQIDLMF